MTDIVSLEKQYILHTYNRPDFVLSHGEGSWLYTTDGNKYLDGGSGIAVNALGHQHPAVVKAMEEAITGLLHVCNLYHTEPQVLLARDLCESCEMADKVFFANSGTEANEGAIKFARKWAKVNGDQHKTGIIACTGSFHGRTMGSLALTATQKYRTPFEPLIGDTYFATFNDLDSVQTVMNDDICAVILEPVQGEGGVTPATEEFLQGVRHLCQQHNALLIYDEVQCGLGRTGTLWGHPDTVQPDIMTLAKPLAGGLPMGAILVSEKVAPVIEPGDHASTFAGGPFVSHVARAVFNQINQPAFLTEVQAKGDYLQRKLSDLVERTPLLTSVRGKGLMWGLLSTIPAIEIMNEAYNHDLMILIAGPQVVRLLPPLTITPEEIDLLVERLWETLEAVG